VADRTNHAVRVLDSEGRAVRSRRDVCHSPTGFAFDDQNVYVTELLGGVKVLNHDLEPVADLGQLPELMPPAGWEREPKWVLNAFAEEGAWPHLTGTEYVRPGVFSSPHGVAVSPGGDLYITEWVAGGRIVRLERLA